MLLSNNHIFYKIHVFPKLLFSVSAIARRSMKSAPESLYRLIYRPLKNVESLDELSTKVLGQMIIRKKESFDFDSILKEGDKHFLISMDETISSMKEAGYSFSSKTLLPFIMEKFSILVRAKDAFDLVDIQGKKYSLEKALDSKTVWSPFSSQQGINPDIKIKSYVFAGVNTEGIPEYLALETDGEVKAYIESGFRAAQLAAERSKHVALNPGLKLLLEENGSLVYTRKENVFYCITKKADFFKQQGVFEKEVGIKLEEQDSSNLQEMLTVGE